MSGDFGEEITTIVLVPSGREGDLLLDLARIWTGTWLLSPAIWVRADDIPLDWEIPPEIPALVIGRAKEGGPGEAPVELFWKLGERHRPKVRLVAVRVKQDDDSLVRTRDALQNLNKYLFRALPQEPEKAGFREGDYVGTSFVRLNLIADAAQVEGLNSSAVFEPEWDANIVASPEDRAEPYGPDAPPIAPLGGKKWDLEDYDPVLNRPARYYGWVLGHIATAGGLWAGLDNSIYDQVPKGGTAHEMCIVQRVVARGVLTDGLAIDLAISALGSPLGEDEQESRALQDSLLAYGIGAIPDSLVLERVDDLVSRALTGFKSEGFGYVPSPELNVWTPPKVSVPTALKLMMRKGWGATIRIPSLLYALSIQQAARKLTIEEGATVVDGSLTWSAGLPRVGTDVFQLPEVPKLSSTGIRAAPQLWRDMKSMIFAAVDGGDSNAAVADALKAPGTGQRVVFPSRTDVLPNPENPWKPDERAAIRLESGSEISWIQMGEAEAAFGEIDGDFRKRRRELDEAEVAARRSQAAVSVLRNQLHDLEFALGERSMELTEVENWLREVQDAAIAADSQGGLVHE